jgi:hypothetical protein
MDACYAGEKKSRLGSSDRHEFPDFRTAGTNNKTYNAQPPAQFIFWIRQHPFHMIIPLKNFEKKFSKTEWDQQSVKLR